MPIKTITCPDCGLVLRVARDATKSTLLYEVGDWQSRCQRRDLDDPAWCLIRREGASGRSRLTEYPRPFLWVDAIRSAPFCWLAVA